MNTRGFPSVGGLWSLILCAAVFTTSALAQGVLSSGINGKIYDTSGNPVAGATVTAVHTPTNATFTAVSREGGQYIFRGLPVGGPYTVTTRAGGFETKSASEITTELSHDIDVDFSLRPEVITMEKFVTTATRSDLDSTADGASSVMTSLRIAMQPTVKRSIGDMARTNPLVTFRQAITDRDDQMIAAAGQNNRYNSILLDGARINDQFGLNASGIQSFFNPISLDTVEQFSVSVSPYDVRQSGFTGAAINAVTKSGTNRFSGTAYTIYTSRRISGADSFGPTAGTKPLDTQKTMGFTLGGPIWKDHLFFFLNYEKFQRDSAASTPGFTPDATQLGQINTRLAAINSAIGGKSIDFGTFGGPPLHTEEEKRLAKIDWIITKDHRLAVRYNDTKGTLPQFGRFSTTSAFNVGAAIANNASRGTNLSSNFYTQARTEKVWTGSLFSSWSENLKTELRYTKTSYEQLTSSPAAFPEVRIFGVSGINNAGAAITNGALFVGTEQFRHGNIIRVETKSYAANADYFWKNFTFSGGFDREDSSFYNLFRAGSYGLIEYPSLAAFLTDTPNAFSRAFYVSGTPVADVSQFEDTGFYLQAKWNVNRRLTMNFGGRLDYIGSNIRPLFNQNFFNAFGIRNDGLPDGVSEFSPRVSFNWAVNDSRRTQLRGGFGHFLGRAPWVFFSNSFSNPGVGRFSLTQTGAGTVSLVSYINNQFDPANPIGVAATDGDPNARRTINLLQDHIHLPSVWRGNLAVDQKLEVLDSTITFEFVHTKTDNALFSDNMNIKPLVVTGSSGPAIGLDGRQRFNGSYTGSGAFSTAFNDVIRIRNTGVGSSTYASMVWDRSMKDHWAANFTYTRGRSTEAQSSGQTVALDGWTRNAVFNQNAIEVSRSDFEVKDRIQFTYAREFEFAKNWKTTASLYYEGHTGAPYSFTYNNDLNNDGVGGNDRIYVPSGASDPIMNFASLTSAQTSAYLAYIDRSVLAKYKGAVVPRNAFTMPWQNRLDLRITQKIPIYKPVEVELFFDFINFGYWINRRFFGYVEELGNNNGVYARRFLANAAYDSTGRLVPSSVTLDSSGNFSVADAIINNAASRWRIQFGAKVKF